MEQLKKFFIFLLLSIPTVFLFSPQFVLAETKGFYTQLNLVSDVPGFAKVTDVNLTNPWGLSRSRNGPWLISDNGTGKASVYNGEGTRVASAIIIPLPGSGSGSASPTGNVFNSVSASSPHDFVVKKNKISGPSIFIFATEDGTISGWNPFVDKTHAVLAVDRSNANDGHGNVGAVYKGLAFGSEKANEFIYATNFRFGTIEMFDANFKMVRSFTDSQITNTCPLVNQCFAPFGIQNINGKLYVTFALQKAGKHDDQSGNGNGFVDVFNTDGTLIKRLIAHGLLNSPWALALAPDNFGQFSQDLLVGNFGDGLINAYDINNGNFDGQLKNKKGNAIQINGLWSLSFGNNGQAGEADELFFTAGINDESNGLFGKLEHED